MNLTQEKRLTGPLMMVLASLLFAMTALFVKMGSESVPVGMIVLARFVFMFGVLEVMRMSGAIEVRPRNKRLLVCRSITAALGGVFYFLAVAAIPIAEAIVLKYTYPIFAVTIAAVAYGERAGRGVLFALAMSLAGILIMMNPSSFTPNIGYLWGILNGLIAGLAVAFLRQLRATDDSSTVLYFHALTGVIVSLPFLSQGWAVPGMAGGLYTLLAAGFGMLGQFSVVYGFRYINTGNGSVVMTLEVVFSALLALIVLGQVPGVWKIAGGVMVIIGATLVSGKGRFRQQDIRKADSAP